MYTVIITIVAARCAWGWINNKIRVDALKFFLADKGIRPTEAEARAAARSALVKNLGNWVTKYSKENQ